MLPRMSRAAFSRATLAGFAATPPDIKARLRVVLGPTNTGKTHLAMERLLAHQSGMIGLPLRLLAREIYDRTIAGHFGKVHRADVALITGEEKILPPTCRYFICTTEAMPISRAVEFLAIDECQLATDPERGHIFTDRILHARGTIETILLGAPTMADILQNLLGIGAIESRPRFSNLRWTGKQKLSRLPRRTAIIAFSAEDIYAIAEVIRQQRGGAAVVMGGLSPRTRNAQVAMYQSGAVDFLVATDAIGMGLNMEVEHVAFAQRRKFDGRQHRALSPPELAQIAGRAGRHTSDGTFGVTGAADIFDEMLVEQIETHQFAPVQSLMWRNPNLDFSTLDALLASLERPAPQKDLRRDLIRAPEAADVRALKYLAREGAMGDFLHSETDIRRLWEVAQIPDFRNTTIGEHSALVGDIFGFLSTNETGIPSDWLAERIDRCDNIEGEFDTLATRLAHIRSWIYVAQHGGWLADPDHWQARSRAVETRLSDALHMKLMGQFVDPQSSILLKNLRDDAAITTRIDDNGDIFIANAFMGRLDGLVVAPQTQLKMPQLKSAATGVGRIDIEKTILAALQHRAADIMAANDTDFSLNTHGEIIWQDKKLATLKSANGNAGGIANAAATQITAYLSPLVHLHADTMLAGAVRGQLHKRLTQFAHQTIRTRLAALLQLAEADNLRGEARGLAFQLVEHKGSLPRHQIAPLLARLDQKMRGTLRQYGVRFGAYNVFLPSLLKPQAAQLLALLTGLEAKRDVNADATALPHAGLTSVKRANLPAYIYRAAGFYPTKNHAIRFDMLERLADIIRPLLADKNNKQGFVINEAMMSIMGCGVEDLADILLKLGYVRRENAADDMPITYWRAAPRKARPPKKDPRKKTHTHKKTGARKKSAKNQALADSPFAVLKTLHQTMQEPPQ